jgi:UDP-N-acetylmuramoyl-tripeptide--D-alanyl-D-alanine ligase
VHVEHFKDVEHLFQEKGKLIKAVSKKGLSVLNANDEMVRRMSEQSKAKVCLYGFDTGADVKGSAFSDMTKFDDNFEKGEVAAKSMFRVEVNNEKLDVELDNIVGQAASSAALAAFAVGQHLDLSMQQIAQGLKNYQPMPGRLRLLPGIKGSLLIDDSYNAAPASVIAGLDVLHEFSPVEQARRIAVLGDMLELGPLSEGEHQRIGRYAVEHGVDLLVTSGERALDIAHGAKEAGLSEDRIQSFKDSEEAGRWLDPKVKTGDIVLIKGSQGVRMEKITKELMLEPLQAKDLLVRQYAPWVDED